MSAADVTTLMEKHKKLEHNVNELRQSVNNANSSLHRIEKALVGDAEMMHTGIVETLKANTKAIGLLENTIEDMQEQKILEDSIKKNDKWWMLGIGGVCGSIGAALLNFFTK